MKEDQVPSMCRDWCWFCKECCLSVLLLFPSVLRFPNGNACAKKGTRTRALESFCSAGCKLLHTKLHGTRNTQHLHILRRCWERIGTFDPANAESQPCSCDNCDLFHLSEGPMHMVHQDPGWEPFICTERLERSFDCWVLLHNCNM